MRVLLVGDYPPPHGGVAVHVKQLHRLLVNRGVASQVLDLGQGGHSIPGEVIAARPGPALVQALAMHARAGWTVHLHSSGNNLKAWVVAGATAATCRAFGAAPIITVHSGLVPGFVAESAWHRSLVYSALLGYGPVIAVSEAIRDALVRVGVERERVTVAPAFLAGAVKRGEPPARWLELQGRVPSRWFCAALHPSPVYARWLLLKAMSLAAVRWPEVGLAVFGPGTDTAELTEAVRAAGLEGRVHGLGELAPEAALAVMAQSRGFIRATTADGDAISVREALALGVPCVASDVAQRPAGTIVFPSGSAPGLVHALAAALEAPRTALVPADATETLINLYRNSTQENLHGQLEPARSPQRA